MREISVNGPSECLKELSGVRWLQYLEQLCIIHVLFDCMTFAGDFEIFGWHCEISFLILLYVMLRPSIGNTGKSYDTDCISDSLVRRDGC